MDIDRIVEYLKGLDADDATLSPGRVFYDFEYHDISSKNIKVAVLRLWRAGCTSIVKDDKYDGNTISFNIWSRTRGSLDVEIACTIDGRGTPKTQCQVYSEEIDDGWYYIFEDYEEWRKYPSKYRNLNP